jgi:hypothetical protein
MMDKSVLGFVARGGAVSKQQEVVHRIRRISRGTPFAIRRWARRFGPSVANKAVRALVASGEVVRMQRGVYVRPGVHPVLGAVTPAPEAAVRVAARARGQRLEIGGPEAARRFGLTTQVPMQTTFLTSGRSRIVVVGRRSVRLEHVSDAYLAHAGTPAGAALSALRHVGRDGLTPEVVERVLDRLDAPNRRRLMRSARRLPPTLARALGAVRDAPRGRSA